jgi:hypothetical protein
MDLLFHFVIGIFAGIGVGHCIDLIRVFVQRS